MRPIIYPYNMGSETSKKLRDGLRGCRRVYPDRNYRPYSSHLIINWGNSQTPNWSMDVAMMMNTPAGVIKASDKLLAFRGFKRSEINIPRFTEDEREAIDWNTPLISRSLLRGSAGRGVRYFSREDRESILDNRVPLYTEYIKKRHEYRVHVWREEVLDVQEKRVREGSEDNNFQIRSHGNGWVFCREEVNISSVGLELAIAAVNSLGLDFGAVDIIYNSHRDMYFVLEVNSAPGLEGETLSKYINVIRRECR